MCARQLGLFCLMRRIVLLLLGCCLLLGAVVLLCGCRHDGTASILPPDCRLLPGDVVFRRGGGVTSHAVLIAEQDGVYSHVGMVVDSAGVPMIVHAVPDEPDFEGDSDRVKMDPPAVFFRRSRSSQGAVLRHRDTVAARRAAAEALMVYGRHVAFDHDYDDRDTTRMYCTELVTHAFLRAGRPLQGISHHHLRFLDIDAHCVLPSDILHCQDLQVIIQF